MQATERRCVLAVLRLAVLAWLAACSGDVGGGAGAGGTAAADGDASAAAGAGTVAGTGGDAAGGTGATAGSGGSAGSAGSAGGDGGDGGAIDAGGLDAATDAGETQKRADPCAGGGPYGDPLPPLGMRTATLVASGFDFVEGPVWIAEQGVLLFSDMHMDQAGGSWPPSTIMRYTPGSGAVELVAQSGSNGLALTAEGGLIAATHDEQTLSLFDLTTGERTSLALTYMGLHFNSPNDLVVRSDGTIYFTDPDWQLGGRNSETGMTGVYRVPTPGDPVLVDGTLDKPNGIALSPDEGTLYVSSASADLLAYAVAPDGSTGTGSVLASPGGSDGMSVDCAGNLYVTAGSVRVFDPQGTELGSITVAESPANVAFGGPDRRTLYITARTSLYAIDLGVPGYPY